jgi:hypothetical protein
VDFLSGGFQADRLNEIIKGVNDGCISAVERGDFSWGKTLVGGKGLQDAGGQRSIKFFVEFEKHQTDLIAMRKKPVARRDWGIFSTKPLARSFQRS